MPEETTSALSRTVRPFWQDVQAFVPPMRSLVEMEQRDLLDAPRFIRSRLKAAGIDQLALAERALNYAEQLLTVRTKDVTPQPHIDLWLNECCSVYLEEQDLNPAPSDPASTGAGTRAQQLNIEAFHLRRDEILMESLTAAWFVLYFLGIPFAHPWERVRRMADERGGFPSGACVTKYIGDIYRVSRQALFPERQQDSTKDEESRVLVLSYAPSALLRRLITRDENNLTPTAVHQLGRCYSLLQLRLYIGADLPIKYFVTEESLTRSWNDLAVRHSDHDAMFNEIDPWIKTIFSKANPRQSIYLLKTNDETAGMSTCVLGEKTGMYVLDTTRRPLPFAGNSIRELLLQSYRTKLNGLETGAQAPDLIELTAQGSDVTNVLRPILMPARSPAGSAA